MLGVAAPLAQANCGSAFCTLNTSWEAQGVATDPGLRIDLRFDYINQDQPRAGRKAVAVGEIPLDHDEQRTLNRNIMTTIDYAPNADWGIAVQIPIVGRDHLHIENDMGVQTPESWQFQKLGDVRVLGRRRLASGDVTHGVLAGVKLPTGKTDVTNDDGEIAERTLQPGTGTTDAIVGYYGNAMHLIGDTPTRFFAQALIQAPVNEHDEFRPGTHYSADVGIAYPAAGTWSGLIQLNALVKDRDRGAQAEPDDSGGSFIWLSPGISWAPTRSTQFYGFVQLPVYQRVSGVQLTADWSASVGVSVRF
jgi:hypothetical protein